MQMRGTLQPKDIVDGTWLSFRPRPFFAIVGCILLAGAIWAIFADLSQDATVVDGWKLAGTVLLLIAGVGVVMPYLAVRDFRQRKDLQREMKMTPSGDGLKIETANGSMTRPWSDYLGWREGRRGFKLYISTSASQYIPKRFFEAECDIDAFRQLLSSHIAER